MNEVSVVITIFLTFLIFLVQRAEKKARRLVLLLSALVFLAVRQFTIDGGNEGISWRALLIATSINFVFWFLIGRYNPPGSSDSIQVIGMDD